MDMGTINHTLRVDQARRFYISTRVDGAGLGVGTEPGFYEQLHFTRGVDLDPVHTLQMHLHA